MASRTSSPARPSRPARKPRRSTSRSRSTRPSSRPARRPLRPGPVARFAAGVGRMIRALWFGLAHLLGASARAIGRGARDLDPAHRRDGLGLTLVAGAVTLAAATWFGVDGWFVAGMDMVMTALFGALAWLSPLILLGLAWRFLRHPDDNATTGRLVIGASALVVGAIGMWHLVAGAATPSDGAEAMAAGGGVIGWLATAPVVAAVGPIVTGVVLVLLLAFGIMVLTATSLASVRAGSAKVARGAVGLVRRDGRDPSEPDADGSADDEADERAFMADVDDARDADPLDAGMDDQDYDEDLQHTTLLADEDRPAAVLMSRVIPVGHDTGPVEAAPVPHGHPARHETVAVTPGAVAGRPEQLTIPRRTRYRLPKRDLLKTGPAHRTATRSNDQVVTALTGNCHYPVDTTTIQRR